MPQAKWGLAISLYGLGENAEAEKLLAELAGHKAVKDQEQLHSLWGSALLALGKPAEAEKALNWVLEKGKTPARRMNSMLNLVEVYIRMKRYADAAAHYGRVVALAPDHRFARYLEAAALATAGGRYGDARERLDRARDAFPDDPLFAEGLGFDVAIGDMTPADKLNWIRDRQDRGHRVAMVGDGINDAPTLAAADASVSFAHATDLAQVHSGLLVLGSDLDMLPRSRRLAEKTRRIIRQNLLWAAGYNFLAVPAAAVGLIAPWGAAIGMSLSSLLVVVNAMRLRRS